MTHSSPLSLLDELGMMVMMKSMHILEIEGTGENMRTLIWKSEPTVISQTHQQHDI